jgi:uncharacterized membrane protein
MNSHRIWGVALGASLAINVFCLGVFITGWMTSTPQHEPRRGPLPPHAAALFEQAAPHQQPGFEEVVNTVHRRHKAVKAALVAEPFDTSKLTAAFAALREAENSAAVLAHQQVVEVAETLSLAERQHLGNLVGRGPEKDRGEPPQPPY